MEQWLSNLSEWTLFWLLLVLLLGAAETGYRLARRATAGTQETIPEVAAIQGATLGLLALLLGFSFSMAATRFEARKELIRDEANAIGTVYLRTSLLPEPQRTAVRVLLRQYVETRFELQAVGYIPEQLKAVDANAGRLQGQLWAYAVTAAEQAPDSVMIELFVASLNDMIDMHGKQLAAMRNRIPAAIFFLLFFVAIVAVGLTGYGSGPRHARSATLTLLVSLLVAAVIMLVVDLHRPVRGMIVVDMASLRDVRDSMNPAPR
jgi:hypothetical protein